jgi:hypothetical protein
MTYSPDVKKICLPLLPTGNFNKSRISDLTCIFPLHYSDRICKMLLPCMFCLPVPNYPMYQSAARPFHKLSRTYISTVLPERFFTRGDGYTKKNIKLFHKFIDICGLMHVHSSREKQSSNRKCQFL